MMQEKKLVCPQGTVHYWVCIEHPGRPTLVFLPGLTADHRLFDQQIAFFAPRYNVLVWDAPGHGASRPFALNFSLMDKAAWLHEILLSEDVSAPVLIGQSMGGYVAQCYMQRYPGSVLAFVSIDSAPLQRKYLTGAELWLLARMEPFYKLYPWKTLQKSGSKGCAETAYGQKRMVDMMKSYEKAEYCALAGHGFRILAEAIDADLPYEIDCPGLLLCGERDKAGSTKRYNRRWTKETGLPLCFIANAGHNANTDQPERVNQTIESFLAGLA